MPMNRILVVGQTPPPYGGQAIMIEKMLQGSYNDTELHHLRMTYSREMDEIGKFSLTKASHLLQLIIKTCWLRLTRKITILYYPPAGPDLIPVLRDVIYLIAVRWLFRTTIFHFHAAGLSDFYSRSPRILRWVMEIAYFKPDIAICLSRHSADDARAIKAEHEFFIPYGVEDSGRPARPATAPDAPPSILYVGVLREDKGTIILLDACRLLRQRGHTFTLRLVGRFASSEFEAESRNFIDKHGLGDIVTLTGVLTGDEKWLAFASADIFCFPTHFNAESFGVCLLEAQSWALPIVATSWRGIPAIVSDGENGLLIAPGDVSALADGLEKLIPNRALRQAMGLAGRARFEKEFTIGQYHARLNLVFQSIQPMAPAGGVRVSQ
jgi:glycosyltransferase involved in cell wall biosynthesis